MLPRKWRESIALMLYNLLWLLLLPFAWLLLKYRARLRNPAYGQRIAERYGCLPNDLQTGSLLFHCVSVGEVVAASCVIHALRQAYPAQLITITTTTPTGSERVRSLFGDSVQHCYLPYDFAPIMRHFLQRLQPKLVVVTEVELWPNLSLYCHKLDLPLVLINGRLTDKSRAQYAKYPDLFVPMLQRFQYLLAQGERDYLNYQSFPLASAQLELTHNIKFDQITNVQVPAEIKALQPVMQRRTVFIAGSTHPGEEDLVLGLFARLRLLKPDLLLVLVPRHPERFAAVAELLKQQAMAYKCWPEAQQLTASDAVLLVNQMGVLTPLYSCADIAFVGGSWHDKGGHNALEPAYFGVPTVMGPHIYNNPEICQALQDVGALHIFTEQTQAYHYLATWLEDTESYQQASQAGQQVITANRGALPHTLRVLTQYL